jgi:CheY-like chemotaxis protein
MERMKGDPATRSIPVVMCTSTDEAGFLQRVHELGALDILPKPPSAELLKGVLDQVRQQASETRVTETAAAGQAAAIEALRAELGDSIRLGIHDQLAETAHRLRQELADGQAASIQQPLADLEARLREFVSSELDDRLRRFRDELPLPDEVRLADSIRNNILAGDELRANVSELVTSGLAAVDPPQPELPDVTAEVDRAVTRVAEGLEHRLSDRLASDIQVRLSELPEAPAADEANIANRVREGLLADEGFRSQLREMVVGGPVDVSADIDAGIQGAVKDFEQRIPDYVAAEVRQRLADAPEANPASLDEAAIAERVVAGLRDDEALLQAIVARIPAAAPSAGEGEAAGDVESPASGAPEQWQRRLQALASQLRQAMMLQMALSAGIAAAVAFAVALVF